MGKKKHIVIIVDRSDRYIPPEMYCATSPQRGDSTAPRKPLAAPRSSKPTHVPKTDLAAGKSHGLEAEKMGKSMGKYLPVNIQKAMENGSFMNELPIF